jgi:Ner family transcriptional regulator
MAPATANWTANQIKARLIEKGFTLKGISVAAGLDPTAASVALRRRWRAAEKAIADALDVPPETIWPSRYDAQQGDDTWPGSPSRTERRARTAARRAPRSEHDR